MRKTLILAKANIRRRKGAFIGIALFMMIITIVAASVISMNENVHRNAAYAADAVNVGDLVVLIPKDNLTDKMLTELENDSAVKEVRKQQCIGCPASIDGKDVSTGFLCVAPDKNPPYFVFNEDASALLEHTELPKKGEIYLPISLRDMYECDIGDTVTFSLGDKELKLKIKAFVEDPFIGSYSIGIKQVFINEEDEQYIRKSLAKYNTSTENYFLHIDLNNTESMEIPEFKKHLDDKTGIISSSTITLSREKALEYTTLLLDTVSSILYVFILLLFIIVLVVMGHNISTNIEMDYTNLGILKSQGFTKGQIRIVFVLQYLSAQLVGIILGLLLAWPIEAILECMVQPITGILSTPEISISSSLAILSIMLIFGCVFVFLKTIKIANISPVRAMSGGKNEVWFDSRFQVSVSKPALFGRIALRQITSNKRRYISITLIVAILIYFMMAVSTLSNLMDSQNILGSLGLSSPDIELFLKDELTAKQREDIEKEINKIAPVKSILYTQSDYISVDGNDFFSTVYEDPEQISGIYQGRAPLYDNEIVVAENMAESLGKGIGDKVTLSIGDSKAEYLISGFYRCVNDLGMNFSCSLSAIQRVKAEYKIRYGEVCLENAEQSSAVIKQLNEKFSNLLVSEVSEIDTMQTLVEEILLAITILIYSISIIFAFFAVTMVCSRTFLREKQDIGIYKSLGFTTQNLRLQFSLRFVFIALIGSMIGIILSLLFNNSMVEFLLKNIGVSGFVSQYTVATFFVPMLLMCLCFFAFSYFASRKVKSVSVKELVTE